ncbi:MAG: hypothetical protein KY453_05060 [Gemmatimonadetes bacterium]|nr:hypothetical protein [Gemmatimonadota bacterium]
MMLPTLSTALVQAADTVVMIAARGPLETFSAIADVVLAVLMILFMAGLTMMLLQLRRMNNTVRQLGDRMQRHVDPLIDRGKVVAENVEYVSMAVRHDVQKLNDSVRALKARLDLASTRMEERIEEFNALMEVVQGEAEDIFLGSAAAVQGVKAGARSLRDGRHPSATTPPPPPEEIEDPDAPAEAGVYVTGRGSDGPGAPEAGGAG